MLNRRAPSWKLFAILAAAAILAYLPALTQPFLEDDYPNLALAIHFLGAWRDVLNNPAFRLRATSQMWMSALYSGFGVNAMPYYAAGIFLHVANTWLVFALGAWRRIGYGVSAFAALFFAVAEGHQEAVMWVSAVNELLQFFFGMAALVAWIRFLQSSRWRWLVASLIAVAGALGSKESAPVFLALMAQPLIDHQRKTLWLAPFGAMAAFAMWSVFTAPASFRFHDGSFSLHAPFWRTLPRSFFAVLWPCGLAALAALLAWRKRETIWIALTWIAIALLPYSFLTYSTRIPSRQTYLAGAGAALLVGAALSILAQTRRRVLAFAVAVLVVYNVGYLWTRKRSQFLKRAEPTEQLIELSARVKGPIYMQCFPRPRVVAEQAVWLMTERPPSELIWDARDASHAAATFCYRE